MKEIIEEGLAPICNMIHKIKKIEVDNTQIQKYNIDKVIKSIKLYKQTQKKYLNYVTCILELSDGRIAVSCDDGTMSLNQVNYETKKWKVLTQKNKAHDKNITSLCEISNKRILSSSYDTTIKVWNVSSNDDIQLIRTLMQHRNKVNKVISLRCSDNHRI